MIFNERFLGINPIQHARRPFFFFLSEVFPINWENRNVILGKKTSFWENANGRAFFFWCQSIVNYLRRIDPEFQLESDHQKLVKDLFEGWKELAYKYRYRIPTNESNENQSILIAYSQRSDGNRCAANYFYYFIFDFSTRYQRFYAWQSHSY